ncbi:hypothetical protein WA158_007367 [Blastocystis sp. Blastoise]
MDPKESIKSTTSKTSKASPIATMPENTSTRPLNQNILPSPATGFKVPNLFSGNMAPPYLISSIGRNFYNAFNNARQIMHPPNHAKVQVDWIKYPSCYKAFIDVPGVSSSSLDISVESTCIVVKGSRQLEYGDDANQLYRERFNGPFEVRIPISTSSVDTTGIRASVYEGVLTIILNRCDCPAPKRIKISDSNDIDETEGVVAPKKENNKEMPKKESNKGNNSINNKSKEIATENNKKNNINEKITLKEENKQ